MRQATAAKFLAAGLLAKNSLHMFSQAEPSIVIKLGYGANKGSEQEAVPAAPEEEEEDVIITDNLAVSLLAD